MTLSSREAATGVSSLPKPQRPDRRPRFLESVATILGGQMASALAALGIEICYARLLGPVGRGQVSLCMMVIAVGVAIGGLGGEIPLMMWTAGREKNHLQWLPVVWLLGMIGCVGAASAWTIIFLRWHPAFLHGITPVLAFAILGALPVGIFLQYLTALFSGTQRFRERAFLLLSAQAAELGGVLLFTLLLGRTALMAILGNMLGLLVACALGAAFLREYLRDWWKFGAAMKKVGAALHLGLLGQSSSLATFVSYRLDVFVLNYFTDAAHVGLYTLGVVISEGLWQIPQAAAVALFPRTAQGADKTGDQFTCFVTRQVFLLACALGLALALAGPLVVPLLFGTRFRPAVEVIWWILPGTVALAAGKVMAADLTARGKPKFNAMIAVLAGCLTILLDFLLIPRMGIRGAALASSVTYLLETGLIGWALKHFLNVSWRVLLLPAHSDFASYRQALQRARSRLRSAIGQTTWAAAGDREREEPL